LAGGEKQRRAFARILLQNADIVVLDEATSALDPDGQDKLIKLLTEDLKATTIVSFGHRPEHKRLHNRKIWFERRRGGAKLVTDVELMRRPASRRFLSRWLSRNQTRPRRKGS
jgi:putative ATP-binding cassette transporter